MARILLQQQLQTSSINIKAFSIPSATEFSTQVTTKPADIIETMANKATNHLLLSTLLYKCWAYETVLNVL
jgi:hypothetical protein